VYVQPLPGQPDQTVRVRVQVIDMQPQLLQLQLPTYLPTRDITQRIARDAGLTAHWQDKRRRLYWIEARGRLLGEDETLADLGIVNHELIYLLPEPPAGSGVEEQVPQYPENRGYAGKGLGAVAMSLLILLVWAVLWGIALTVERSTWAVAIPGIATGLFSVSLSRHMWGGLGSQLRILLTAAPVFVLVFVVVFLPTIMTSGLDAVSVAYRESVVGFVTGFVGIFLGWLAWWGSVEPLPAVEQKVEVAQQQVVTANCGICQGGVTPDVRKDCEYGCGHVFHTGCHQARLAVYRGDPRFCAVCNSQVA
jgi:uncharacterized ubiquitin-like protein YukD